MGFNMVRLKDEVVNTDHGIFTTAEMAGWKDICVRCHEPKQMLDRAS